MSLINWSNSPLLPAFRSFADDFFTKNSLLPEYSATEVVPATNIEEKENAFIVKMAIPGVEKKDISIEMDHNLLSISATKEKSKSEENKKFTRKEYEYSSFQRSFTLPDNIDKTAISASCKDGELQLILPKSENKKTEVKKIAIKG